MSFRLETQREREIFLSFFPLPLTIIGRRKTRLQFVTRFITLPTKASLTYKNKRRREGERERREGKSERRRGIERE